MYRAIDIARYIIDYCTKEDAPISNLKLQKILYYLQVFYAKNNERLFGEDICAWQYGPVVPEVYFAYGGYGGATIRNEYKTNISEKDQNKINYIINKLRGKSPLMENTHITGGPWDIVFQNGAGNKRVIDWSLLKQDDVVKI